MQSDQNILYRNIFSFILTTIITLVAINFDHYFLLSFICSIFILFTVQYLTQSQKIVVPPYLIVMIISPILTISLPELLYFKDQSPDVWITQNSWRHTLQFLFLIPCFFIPSIIKNLRFNLTDFFSIILYINIFILFFNLYIFFQYENNRSLLNSGILWPIILYDYAITSLCLILLIYSIQKSSNSIFILLLSSINIFLIISHGSRGAWIGIPIIFVLLAYLYRDKYIKILISLSIIIILSIGSTLLPYSQISERIINFKQQTQEISNDKNYNNNAGTRLVLWKFALENFKKNPILGQGFIHSYKNICELKNQNILNTCQIHIHNVYLQLLYAHGILGFITSLIMFIFPILFYIKKIKVDKQVATIGFLFCTYIALCNLTDYSLFSTHFVITFFLINACLMSFIHHSKSDDDFKMS